MLYLPWPIEILRTLLPIVLEHKKAADIVLDEEERAVLSPHETDNRMGSYVLTKKPDGSLYITGKRIEQFTVMTDFYNEGGVRRFRDVLKKIGLHKAIKRERENDDTDVFIGDICVTEHI